MRYLINLMLSVVLIVTTTPVSAGFNPPGSPGDEWVDESLDPNRPLGQLNPIISQIDSWTSSGQELVTFPFVDEHGSTWNLSINFSTRRYSVLTEAGLLVGSATMSVADAATLKTHLDGGSNGGPPTAIVCGGLCIGIITVLLASVLSAGGYLIARNIECNDMYTNALNEFAEEALDCVRQDPPGDGRQWNFRIDRMPSPNVCGSTGAGTCSLQ